MWKRFCKNDSHLIWLTDISNSYIIIKKRSIFYCNKTIRWYVFKLNNSNRFRKTVKLFYKRFRTRVVSHTSLWPATIFEEIPSGIPPPPENDVQIYQQSTNEQMNKIKIESIKTNNKRSSLFCESLLPIICPHNVINVCTLYYVSRIFIVIILLYI